MAIKERMADFAMVFTNDEDKQPTQYYVGDLCYVMHDCWEEVCGLTFPEDAPPSGFQGEFALADGRTFFIYSTAFGDGEYSDDEGRRYLVDSGSLGAIKVSDIKDSAGFEEAIRGGWGHVHTFDYELIPEECFSISGVITLGEVEIDTAADDEIDD